MHKQTHKWSLDSALADLEQARRTGAKIVFTNGCFDILHVGHLRYLTQAKSLGNFLFIGVNSDSSVRELKGDQRPIVSEDERCEMLLGLKAVDAAAIFCESTPIDLIKQVKPDILCKGGDWTIDKIVGGDFVQSYGGQVLSLPFVPGRSSTAIIEKIIKC
jgi:rfaE bifunctional protein nucleotidyltransferase chain/domain